MKTVNIEAVKQAIASQKGGYKWNRSSFEYALSGMYTYYTEWSLTKLPELKELFYKRCETHFHLIERYTTFNGVNCWIETPVIEEYKPTATEMHIRDYDGVFTPGYVEPLTTKPFVGKLMFSSPINKENSFGAWNLSEDTESEIDFTIREDGTGFFEWSVEELDEYEEGSLTFEANVLVDYDGVFELPSQLVEYLEKLGYNVDYCAN